MSSVWIRFSYLAVAVLFFPVTALVPPLPLSPISTAAISSAIFTNALSTATVSTLLSATDDVEIAELPPVYVPALFGVALLVGVGLLTGSLGNVMDEEASCEYN
jgi:hypothetical protein